MARPGGTRSQAREQSIQPVTRHTQLTETLVTSPGTVASNESEHGGSDARGGHGPTRRVSACTVGSAASRHSTFSQGRDYYPTESVKPLKPSEAVPTATYMERGQRWMEKEEVVSLHQALHAMDMKQQDREDDRIYRAALDEASELVWQHENAVKPRDPGTPYSYRDHLRKNSYAHARAASIGRHGEEVIPTGLARDVPRSVSNSSAESEGDFSHRSRVSSESCPAPIPLFDVSPRESIEQARPPLPRKSYGAISTATSSTSHRRRSSMKRNISGEVNHPFSGDQIWEEPEGSSPARPAAKRLIKIPPLRARQTDPLNQTQPAPEKPTTSDCAPGKQPYLGGIQQQPPTQSRNAEYTVNDSLPSVQPNPGLEKRSDDIRQATSMKLKDRSVKLPTPSAVSDSPSRPIVSFNTNWKPPQEAKRIEPVAISSTTTKSVANRSIGGESVPSTGENVDIAQSIPTFQIDVAPEHQKRNTDVPMGPVPVIVTPDDESRGPSPPTISVSSDDETTVKSSRPLPTPGTGPRLSQPRIRPRPQRFSGSTTGNRATATCHECGYPIEGRFVALAGCNERFHPACFSCYSCGTGLEALEIFPEPDMDRNERLDRIQLRACGEALEEVPGKTMGEDGDDRLRFYCHLDWHEFFAPRCKHCKTPIIGEHIVALGHHWHDGHFFCAECGDPFDHNTTHIEKDGYAWCINCQTKRTERRAPKCQKCKMAVIGQYIIALGGEWHDECFRCSTCRGGFDDGQIFPKQGGEWTLVLCTRCQEMELKS